MITLSSDFGSPYPAAMKGVLLQGTDARLVDVSHAFPRQDVRSVAFWLREVMPYFPPAVHLVVVDPGVGTDRAALAVRAGDHALVGPDNGVLLPVARELAERTTEPEEPATGSGGDSAALDVFEVTYDDPASSTFHGRDVFAPAAAAVHEAGVGAVADADDLVPADRFRAVAGVRPADEWTDLRFPDPVVEADGASGEVLVVDDFGNAVTNVPGSVLDDYWGASVDVNGERVIVRRTYGDVTPGQRLVTVGSHGNVELAVNRGRGDEGFGIAPGDPVRLAFP
ncbi:MAG: S-adenosyl-l-methionine hydroxide adenosyltransferase family protein [Haloarculaceae archaeon]